MAKLSEKQKRFADAYITNGNASESARIAGYSPKYINSNVQKLLRNTAIKKYIDERLAEQKAKRLITIEEALEINSAIIRGENRVITKTIINSDGSTTNVEVIDTPTFAERSKALEHLLKINGLFTQNLNIQAPTPIVVVADYGDDEE